MLLPRNTTLWGIGLTETFRNTSKALFKRNPFKGYGSNLQNPSDRICRLYEPDEKKIFIQADQAGAEALIVAYLCPDGNFRQLFKCGIKPHTYVAMHLFASYWIAEGFPEVKDWLKMRIEDLPKQTRWKEFNKYVKVSDARNNRYFIGKKACHSFNYRKQPATFIFDVLKESEGRVALSLSEGKRVHGVYHGLFPEIEQVWHKDIERILQATRTLLNLFGHPRVFYGNTKDDKLIREATAFVPQSTVGCITNYAFVELQYYIEDNALTEWDLLNNKHDSILLQVPNDQDNIQHAIKILKQSIEIKLTSPRNEEFRMRSEVSVGMNWGKYDPEENPEGMKEAA